MANKNIYELIDAFIIFSFLFLFFRSWLMCCHFQKINIIHEQFNEIYDSCDAFEF